MIRVAIHGYGRIGRSVLRAFYERQANKERLTDSLLREVQIVAINELATPAAIAHLTEFDTVHGRFQGQVAYREQQPQAQLLINDDVIELFHEANPHQLPWGKLGIDLVLECSGSLHSREENQVHLDAGAKQVLISHPSCQTVDATVIYGINEQSIPPQARIVSNGSCTTNCVVPVIDILDKHLGIQSGAITTIHSAMNDQPITDAYHTDLRRTRAAGQSIIPVDTKLARGIERILPHLHNKFEAISVRVPTVNVTAIDLSVTVNSTVDIDQVNQLIAQYAQGAYQTILGYTEIPLVSCDFNHDPRSVIVDGTQTRVSNGHLIKMLLWCDNEWGFANRMLDTLPLLYQQRAA